MTTATGKDKTTGPATTTECAFCGGTGRDPYEVLSKLSNCQVCNGRKTIQMPSPIVVCAYCHGTGKQRHTRLTCSACGGRGAVTLAGPTTKCTQCGGNGREMGADLPCSLCKGTGLIALKPTVPKQENRTASKGGAAGRPNEALGC